MTTSQPYSRPLVIDLYHGDGVENFIATKRSGILGVIHKASQGTSTVDHLYAPRRAAWLEGPQCELPNGDLAQPLWGAYHFYTGGGAAEADFFLHTTQPDERTLLALDWEPVPPHGATPGRVGVVEFITYIHVKTGQWPVVYSGNSAKEALGTSRNSVLAPCRLWLAQYGRKWTVQRTWQEPWLWQNNGDNYGPGPHTIPGIAGLCDNNCLTGSMTPARLIAEWSSAPAAAGAAP